MEWGMKGYIILILIVIMIVIEQRDIFQRLRDLEKKGILLQLLRLLSPVREAILFRRSRIKRSVVLKNYLR